mmetsp:Transcript_4690/g.11963  ORF Transcript_4690/g.11963 Transcript_4690/m.11963 type:complete len:507 (-) Transcript_4690:2795-4315(-)
MKILLISVGSRGDHEPFCALADQLVSKGGHQVIQAIQSDYVKLVPESVVDQQTQKQNDGKNIIELPFTTNDFYKYTASPTYGQDHASPRVKFVGIIADCIGELVLPTTRQILDHVLESGGVDVIVCSSLARQVSFLVSDMVGMMMPTEPAPKVYLIHLQPLLPTNQFPHYSETDKFIDCVFGSKENDEEKKNNKENYLDQYWDLERYQHEFLDERLRKTYHDVVESKKYPDLINNTDDDPRSILSFDHLQLTLSGKAPNVCIVNAFSNELIPIPTDTMTPQVYNVGALADSYIPQSKTTSDDEWIKLQTWLKDRKEDEKDPEPQDPKSVVCIGFGSMPFDTRKVKAILSMLKELKVRVVLVGKALDVSSIKNDEDAEFEVVVEWMKNDVYYVDSVQYARLLPYCDVFVCHGGAGAVHAGIRAGCAIVVSPMMGDQFTFAKLLEVKGLGAQAGSSMPTMTPHDLKVAVSKALECTSASKALGIKIRQQPVGVEALSQIIENNFASLF